MTMPDQPLFPARREVIGVGLGLFGLHVARSWWMRQPAAHRVRVPVMGTIAELIVVHHDERTRREAAAAAVSELQRVETMMTRFTNTSDVGRVNATPGQWVTVHPATLRVLARATEWTGWSGGRFDPTLGLVSAAWDVTRRTSPPSPGDLPRGHSGLELHRAQSRVRLDGPLSAVDLGGIAKGYGVDAAIDALRGHGVRHAVVNVGGDLFALGSSPDGDAWSIGIRDPFDPEHYHRHVSLRDEAVATSGDYLRFFMHGMRRYHHLLDARTGAPVRTPVRSVTVAAASCMDADAAATAVFGMGRPQTDAVLARVGRACRVVDRVEAPDVV